MELGIGFLVGWIGALIFCMWLAGKRGRGMGRWLCLGVLFGWVAVIILAFLPSKIPQRPGV